MRACLGVAPQTAYRSGWSDGESHLGSPGVIERCGPAEEVVPAAIAELVRAEVDEDLHPLVGREHSVIRRDGIALGSGFDDLEFAATARGSGVVHAVALRGGQVLPDEPVCPAAGKGRALGEGGRRWRGRGAVDSPRVQPVPAHPHREYCENCNGADDHAS